MAKGDFLEVSRKGYKERKRFTGATTGATTAAELQSEPLQLVYDDDENALVCMRVFSS
ncbi:hypothetical protein ACLOJK_013328, partial [Asimina triloba]